MRPGWTLVLIFALAAGLRLLVLASTIHEPAKLYAPDSAVYQQLALNLLHHGTFSRDPEPPFRPAVGRTPFYPAFLAAVFAVAGPNPVAAIVTQILVGSLTAVLTLWLARQLGWSPAAATGAALLVAVDPVSVLTSNLLLTDILFTTLLVGGLAALARYWVTRDGRWIAAAALGLAAANLTRPVSQVLPLALLPLFALAAARSRIRASVAAGIVLVVLSSTLTAAWAYRNYRAVGVFTLSTAAAGVLTYYRAREVLANAEGVSEEEAGRRIRARIMATPEAGSLPGVGRVAGTRQIGLAILLQYPGLTAAMMVKGAARMMADPGFTLACTLLAPESSATECFPGKGSMNEPGVLGRAVGKFREMRLVPQLTLVGSTLLLGATYLGAAIGTVRLVRARRWLGLAFLLVVIGYFVAVSAGTGANSRFRIPIVPFLALLAVAALDGTGAGGREARVTARRPPPPG